MQAYFTQGMYRYNKTEMQLLVNALTAYQTELAEQSARAYEENNTQESEALDDMMKKSFAMQEQLQEDIEKWNPDYE